MIIIWIHIHNIVKFLEPGFREKRVFVAQIRQSGFISEKFHKNIHPTEIIKRSGKLQIMCLSYLDPQYLT